MNCWHENAITRKLFKHKVFRNACSTIGPRYVLYTVPPVKMYLDLREQWGISKMILKQGLYDPFASRMMKQWIGLHGNMIDIGANIGYYSLLGASYTDGRVFAFEPEPHNFKLLSDNITLNRFTNITPMQKAVGDISGKLSLYKSKANAGDHHVYPTSEHREAVEVDVVRIDDELSGISDITYVKIDVQGYEERVVRGMEKILRSNRNIMVNCEFWPHGMRLAGSNPEEFLNYMCSHGFSWQAINDEKQQLETIDKAELLRRCSGEQAVDLLFTRN